MALHRGVPAREPVRGRRVFAVEYHAVAALPAARRDPLHHDPARQSARVERFLDSVSGVEGPGSFDVGLVREDRAASASPLGEHPVAVELDDDPGHPVRLEDGGAGGAQLAEVRARCLGQLQVPLGLVPVVLVATGPGPLDLLLPFVVEQAVGREQLSRRLGLLRQSDHVVDVPDGSRAGGPLELPPQDLRGREHVLRSPGDDDAFGPVLRPHRREVQVDDAVRHPDLDLRRRLLDWRALEAGREVHVVVADQVRERRRVADHDVDVRGLAVSDSGCDYRAAAQVRGPGRLGGAECVEDVSRREPESGRRFGQVELLHGRPRLRTSRVASQSRAAGSGRLSFFTAGRGRASSIAASSSPCSSR